MRDDLFDSLLAFLEEKLEKEGEFTVEANPESLSEEKASIMKSHRVNRVSLGAESFDPALLSLMGRKHTEKDVKDAVNCLREVGINNVSLDFIYGLPGQTVPMFFNDLDKAIALGVPHLSAYSLTVEEGTAFFNKGYREANGDLLADFYEAGLRKLREAGYRRYEVSNFAKAGYESRHNLTYWKDLPYVGCGLGASGYLEGRHYKNTRNLAAYLKGETVKEREGEPTLEERLSTYLLTNLRLEEGFSLRDFERRFGFSFLSHFGDRLSFLEGAGLLKSVGGSLLATDEGLLRLDGILLKLID